MPPNFFFQRENVVSVTCNLRQISVTGVPLSACRSAAATYSGVYLLVRIVLSSASLARLLASSKLRP